MDTRQIKALYMAAEEAIDTLEKALIEAGIRPANRTETAIMAAAYPVLYPPRPRPDMAQADHEGAIR